MWVIQTTKTLIRKIEDLRDGESHCVHKKEDAILALSLSTFNFSWKIIDFLEGN